MIRYFRDDATSKPLFFALIYPQQGNVTARVRHGDEWSPIEVSYIIDKLHGMDVGFDEVPQSDVPVRLSETALAV